MYPTPKMITRNSNENAELPLFVLEFDVAARKLRAAWTLGRVSGMVGSAFENG